MSSFVKIAPGREEPADNTIDHTMEENTERQILKSEDGSAHEVAANKRTENSSERRNSSSNPGGVLNVMITTDNALSSNPSPSTIQRRSPIGGRRASDVGLDGEVKKSGSSRDLYRTERQDKKKDSVQAKPMEMMKFNSKKRKTDIPDKMKNKMQLIKEDGVDAV